MYYLRSMAYSQLFQALIKRNLPTKSSGCNFNGRILTYKARFRLCHSNHTDPDRYRFRTMLAKEKQKISKFFLDNFKSQHPEEKKSISTSFERGETLYIIGFNNKGDAHSVIAVIMYVSCQEGSYINWFVVDQRPYDHSRFGKFANEQSFCNMGLGAFLLQMVQLQEVIQGFSTDLYLQENMSTPAQKYYENRGFKKLESNDPKLLPDTLYEWYTKLKETNAITPFVYFATTEELENDAKERKEDPQAAETHA